MTVGGRLGRAEEGWGAGAGLVTSRKVCSYDMNAYVVIYTCMGAVLGLGGCSLYIRHVRLTRRPHTTRRRGETTPEGVTTSIHRRPGCHQANGLGGPLPRPDADMYVARKQMRLCGGLAGPDIAVEIRRCPAHKGGSREREGPDEWAKLAAAEEPDARGVEWARVFGAGRGGARAMPASQVSRAPHAGDVGERSGRKQGQWEEVQGAEYVYI